MFQGLKFVLPTDTLIIWSMRLLAPLCLVVFTAILYSLAYVVYNLYLHPLRQLPGPRLWIALPFMRHLAAIRGQLDAKLCEFHDIYGAVVRYTPDDVSFITAQAWKDIYGHGHAQLPKNVKYRNDETPDIIFSNDADHSRYRKALAHAFSEKGIRDQEPIINTYVNLLIDKLKKIAVVGETADMVEWYNLTTFDLIGDLTFGESFEGLKNAKCDEWVAITFQSMKALPFKRAAHEYPIIMSIVRRFLPAPLNHARETHRRRTNESVIRRIHNTRQHGRGDFMDSMLKYRGAKDGLTDDELTSNSNILVVGGSETTASLLSGVTYLLLRTPEALRKLTTEVRSAFASEEDINFMNATGRLPYMLACLEEALRMYPPLPTASQRICPPGAPTTVSGYDLPAGTKVAVPQLAAFRSQLNFHHADQYIPERWLHSAISDNTSPFYNDNRDVHQPFSVGPRNCIGRNLAYNEMRLILARVLWNFDLELCDEGQNWIEQKTYVIWEKGPLLCRLHMRP